MDDTKKTREELLAENRALRAQVIDLERQVDEWTRTDTTLRQRQSGLESLLETSRNLASVLAEEELLEVIAERVTQLLESDECVLFYLLPDGETLEAVLALGPVADQIRGARMAITQGLTGVVMRTGEPLVVNDAHDDPRSVRIPPPEEQTPQAHVMIAPLISRGRKMGAMVLNRVPGRPFTDNDLQLLIGFAQHVAVAMENSRLYAEIQQYTSELERRVDVRTAELKQQKDEVEAIINSVADGLLIIDKEGMVVSVNPATTQITGAPAEALVGINAIEAVQVCDDPATRARIGETWKKVSGGESCRFELPLERLDGSIYDVDLNVSPLSNEDGDVRGFVVVMRDMTMIKEVQRMKDDFITNVTHELRTPITSIKLRYGLLEASPERFNDHLAVLYRETDRLSHIIDDLLTLARIDQDRTEFRLEALDMNLLARQYVSDRLPVAQSRDLDLSFVEHVDMPLVSADAGLLGQALGIILTNALNYTPSGGRVQVRTSTHNTGHSAWAGVTIVDSGPGIPEDECKHLFGRFFRGEAAHQSRIAGTGLGLAIAKEIVDRHSGWIEVRGHNSSVNHDDLHGASFTIWLPV